MRRRLWLRMPTYISLSIFVKAANDMEEDALEQGEQKEFVSTSRKRFIVLVIYDIVDNKRRNKMVKALEAYGLRVQKSAFEAYVTRKKYDALARECAAIIDTEEDSLRIYLLADHTSVRSWGVGDVHTEDVIIF